MRHGKAIAAVAVFGLIAAGGVVALARGARSGPPPPPPPPPSPVGGTGQQTATDPMLDARTLGDPRAPVTVYELSDFQCPYCREFWAETLPLLKDEYVAKGHMRLIFINLPLPSLHPNAAAAHEFAMCAARQGRFWPVHDLLYEHQRRWASLENPAALFMEFADTAKLARAPLTQCLTTGAMRTLITTEVQMAARGGITSTPTFIIDRKALQGAAPIESWRPILDSIIEAKRPH